MLGNGQELPLGPLEAWYFSGLLGLWQFDVTCVAQLLLAHDENE